MQQLQETHPAYFVSEYGDAKPFITGSPLDSYESLQQWPELSNYLTSEYTPDTVIGHFRIFRRLQTGS
jgi:hypothetical protein